MGGKILILGSEGLVGSRFLELSAFKNKFHTPKQVELDITNSKELEAIFKSFDFSAVVNFAAYTDVGKAETERENKDGDCWQVNVEGPKNIAEAIKSSGRSIHYVHISTDMVFSGDKRDKGPYSEDHPVEKDLDRLTWYGYTKGQGEKAVRETLREKATILRLIYPVRASYPLKMDYLRKPLDLYDQGKLYPMFSDQQVSITFIDEAVKVLDLIIKGKKTGTFHSSSSDTSTPLELVSYLLQKTRNVKDVVLPITVKDFLKKTSSPSYRYPLYGGLKVDKTEKELGIKFRIWKEIIDELVKQGLGS